MNTNKYYINSKPVIVMNNLQGEGKDDGVRGK